MLARVATLPHVSGVLSPYAEPGSGQISRDGKTGFAVVLFDQKANELPTSAIKDVINTAEAARGGAAGRARRPGDRADRGPAARLAHRDRRPRAAVVLLISFGSFLAMGLPIVTALFGLGTGVGLIGLGTHVVDMADFSLELAAMIGLGVGIDYALFILTRYREVYGENGGDVRDAVLLAMDTAGRAVLFAGATVVIALLGMFALGVSFLYGLAVAAALAVLLVLAASVTLLPALLTFFGHGSASRAGWRGCSPPAQARSRARLLGALDRRHPASPGDRRDRRHGADARARRARALAPARNERRGQRPDLVHLPARVRPARAGLRARLQRAAQLVVQLPTASDGGAVDAFRRSLAAAPGVVAVAPPRLNPSGDVVVLTVYPSSSPQSERRRTSSSTCGGTCSHRSRSAPAQPPTSAGDRDSHRLLQRPLEQALALHRRRRRAVGAAARGRLPLVVDPRSGGGDEPALDRRRRSASSSPSSSSAGSRACRAGPIEAFLPVLMFAIVFGLSMDYEVFLVSRIHEEWTRQRDSTAAVRDGLIATGR